MSKWEEKRLGEIANIVAGGTPSTSVLEYWNGSIGWVTPADLSNYSNRYIKKGERNISETGLNKSSAKLLPKGTVLLTTRAPIGYVVIADNEISTNQGFKNLICDKDIVDNRYIYYWLKHNRETLQIFATGATFPELSGGTLKKIKCLIPDLPTQERIADILSTYDDLIENNNRRIELLEKVAQELYKEWFVRFRFPNHENAKFVNGLPDGWSKNRLDSISNIIMGQSPSSEFYNNVFEGLPFHQGVGSYGDRFVIDETYCSQGKKIAIENSILFSVRAPVGRLNLTKNKVIIGRGLASINHNKGLNSYLFLLLKEIFYKDDLLGNGAIFSSITKTELFAHKVLVPPFELISEFNKTVKIIDDEISNIHSKNQNLKKQRDLLLPRLMSGKLEV